VEDNLKLGIGIDVEKVGKKNLRQLFDLLCHEITEVCSQSHPLGEGFYDPTIHIFFRKKLDLEKQAVQATQSSLSERGIDRCKDQIREALNRI
jgi:hypothetical protein